jgi:hypothetical protein
VKSVTPKLLNVPVSIVPVSGSSPSQIKKNAKGPRVSFKSDNNEEGASGGGVKLSLSSLQKHNELSQKNLGPLANNKPAVGRSQTAGAVSSSAEQDELPEILNKAMKKLTERAPNFPVLGGSRRGSAAFSLTEGGFLNPGSTGGSAQRKSQVRIDAERNDEQIRSDLATLIGSAMRRTHGSRV